MDVPGQWTSHCLDLDIVSQGNDPAHALAMLEEAVTLCVLNDLLDGLDPRQVRAQAPDESWTVMWRAYGSEGERYDGGLPGAGATTDYVYIVPMRMIFTHEKRETPPHFDVPAVMRRRRGELVDTQAH